MPNSIKTEICPRCNKHELDENGRNAVSRRDNKTQICSSCGAREAFCDFYKYNSLPISEINVERNFHKKIQKPYSKYRSWHKTIDEERQCQT